MNPELSSILFCMKTRLAFALAITFAAAQSRAAETQAVQVRHKYIASELPGRNAGLGGIEAADFDRDGDIDVVVFNRGDNQVYWFENAGKDQWPRHLAGSLSIPQLGIAVLDVDGDGWTDVVFGGVWLRNPGRPAQAPFEAYTYDSRIRSEIHDLSVADIDGDGRADVVALGDREGLFWYSLPADPKASSDWKRHTITLDVLDQNADIHGGFAPGGIGDLDGDGDMDVVLADRWLENQEKGARWVTHRFHFGRRGPWGVSSRSWVADVDGDGDLDIIICDCDGQNSGVAWLENNGQRPPRFRTQYLANRAPGTRGSFHSLWFADFDGDGNKDILLAEQEDPNILPAGASPRYLLFRRLPGKSVQFAEQVLLDARIGGHDLRVADMDGDGDLDIVSKVWSPWNGNANAGRAHVSLIENLSR
jgi:hypothetical protein